MPKTNLLPAAAKLWIKTQKDQIVRLHQEIYGERLKSMSVYEGIAKTAGFKDWNTLWGTLEKACSPGDYSEDLGDLLLKIDNGGYRYATSIDLERLDLTDSEEILDLEIEENPPTTISGKIRAALVSSSYYCSELYSDIGDRLHSDDVDEELPDFMESLLSDLQCGEPNAFTEDDYLFPIGESCGLHFCMCYFSILLKKPLPHLLCEDTASELERKDLQHAERRRAAHEARVAVEGKDYKRTPEEEQDFQRFFDGELHIDDIPLHPEYDPIVKFKLGALVETEYDGQTRLGFVCKYRQEGSVWAFFPEQEAVLQLGPFDATSGVPFMNPQLKPLTIKSPRPKGLHGKLETYDSGQEFEEAFGPMPDGIPRLGRVWELANPQDFLSYLTEPRH